MPILGLLLLLAAAGLTVDVVVENTSSIDVQAAGTTLSLSPGWLFVTGIAVGVVALAGLATFIVGVNRARRRRAEMVETRNSVETLQAERDRLAAELEGVRAGRNSADDREPVVIDVSDERGERATHRVRERNR